MNPTTTDEYDWGNSRINPLEPMTYQDAFQTVDQMSDQEICKLGYTGDEELFKQISQSFMIIESD
ncbi:hypothetical protein KBY85_15225 [Cyanobium sp. BA5m-10]|uniref:hypothetical protein n=1 Tax=Cyanobium sp. BA5m-10 TaxID=2823705 RepID=UPI0020CD53E9|nr:hypothetical protein [Cyanobium sp. BA5m-10]MCP9905476.1 hypothetical protein [Cyanobium sp. BA5m-10]